MHRLLAPILPWSLALAVTVLTGCENGHLANTPYLGETFQSQFINGNGRPHEVVDNVSYWDGGGSGPASITINLSEQRAYFYRGQQLVGVALVATGKEGYDTPAGTFRIMEKIQDKESDLFGWMYDASGAVVNYDADIRIDPVPPGGRFEGAKMPYWMRLTGGGVGMHQGPIPVPGSPASHGCIRVSKLVVADFFENAHVGMPVRVVY